MKPTVIKAKNVNFIIPDKVVDLKSTYLMLEGCYFYSKYDNKMEDTIKVLKERIEQAKKEKEQKENSITSYNVAYSAQLKELGLE